MSKPPQKILIQDRKFISWMDLLQFVNSKLGSEDPEEVSCIKIEPNLLTIEYKTKGFR